MSFFFTGSYRWGLSGKMNEGTLGCEEACSAWYLLGRDTRAQGRLIILPWKLTSSREDIPARWASSRCETPANRHASFMEPCSWQGSGCLPEVSLLVKWWDESATSWVLHSARLLFSRALVRRVNLSLHVSSRHVFVTFKKDSGGSLICRRWSRPAGCSWCPGRRPLPRTRSGVNRRRTVAGVRWPSPKAASA